MCVYERVQEKESCFAESFLYLFVGMVRCGVLGLMILSGRFFFPFFVSFTCVAMMLSKCALKCN